MSIRDGLARRFTGGHPFMIRPDQMLVEVDINGSAVERAVEGDGTVTGRLTELANEFGEMGFDVQVLDNTGVISLQAERLTDVLDNVQERRQAFSDAAIATLTDAKESARSVRNRTIVGGYGVGQMQFNSATVDTDDEASIRNQLVSNTLHNPLTDALEELSGVLNVQMRYTRTTFGPRSLRVDPGRLTSILPEQLEEATQPKLPDVFDLMDVEEAWEYSTGEDAVVAIFDTGFCEEYFSEDRIIDTFHGEDVDSVFSTEEMEGHGTMCGVAAAGNTDDGAPFDGVAKDADLILVRLTDEDHALGYTEEALDWFSGVLDDIDRPVISNHSYGIPLCSANAMGLCDETTTKVARVLAERDDHQAIYAAGNEGDYCGSRLSGLTNGINGINSDDSSITVGALRSSGAEVQRYSSHGNGTCSSSDDPKPDVSAPIPQILPFACETIDMSSGIGGSSGGTSTAAPIVAGISALIASELGHAEKDVLEEALEETATLPRKTQVNIFKGRDARFGHGMVNAKDAIEYALED